MTAENNFLALIIPSLDFLILQSLAVILTAVLLKGMKITSILGPIITVIGISWVNNLYWDSNLFFGLPTNFTFRTLGLVFCNSVILWIIVKLAPGIEMKGILTAIKASVLLSISSYLIITYCSDLDWEKIFTTLTNYLTDLRNYFLTNSNAK